MEAYIEDKSFSQSSDNSALKKSESSRVISTYEDLEQIGESERFKKRESSKILQMSLALRCIKIKTRIRDLFF